jgi:hypothetical protein
MELPSFITERPWLSAGIVALGGIVLYLYMRSGSSGSDVAPVNGTSITYQTNPNADAISAQYSLQQEQMGMQYTLAQGDLNLRLAQIQAAVIASGNETQSNADYYAMLKSIEAGNNQTEVQIAQLQTSTSVDIQESSDAAAVAIARIAGDVSILDSNNELKTNLAALDVRSNADRLNAELSTLQLQLASEAAANQLAANLEYTTITANRDITINEQNVGGAVAINQQNVNGAVAINEQNVGGAVAINEQNTIAYRAAVEAAAGVQNNYIDTTGDLISQQLSNQARLDESILQQLGYGNFNKGGDGGRNQVSVVGALLGDTAIGVSAQSASATSSAASAAKWTGIFSSIAAGATGVAKALVP